MRLNRLIIKHRRLYALGQVQISNEVRRVRRNLALDQLAATARLKDSRCFVRLHSSHFPFFHSRNGIGVSGPANGAEQTGPTC